MLGFIRLLIDILMGTFPGYAAKSYKMAATMIRTFNDDVVGNFGRHLVNQYRMLLNEWVVQIEVVDASLELRREAWKMASTWAKAQGFMDEDNNLDTTKVSLDLWKYWLEKKRISLAAERSELFHYMKGIGFVIKADDWQDAAFKLRAYQMALNYLKLDDIPLTTALFDCTEDRLPTFTEADMDMEWFTKLDDSTPARLSRCYAQDGHAFYRGRLDQAGYDGDLESHDREFALMDEMSSIPVGYAGRPTKIVSMDGFFNRICYLMQDVDRMAHLQGAESKWAMMQRRIIEDMGPQLVWIDKCNEDRRDPRWQSLHHWNAVTDPTNLKLFATRAVNDPDLPLPQRFENKDLEAGVFTANRCILDKDATEWYSGHNKAVFAVSTKFQSRAGDHRYVVVYMSGWKDAQLYMVYSDKDWSFAIKPGLTHTVYWGQSEKELTSRFLGVQIEGALKDRVFDLMGIQVMRDGIKQVRTQDIRFIEDAELTDQLPL